MTGPSGCRGAPANHAKSVWSPRGRRGSSHQLAIRGARRRPFLAGIIVLTLALGPSLTTVVLSIADRVLFRELPYSEPARLVAFSTVRADRPEERTPLGAAVITRVTSDVRLLSAIGAFRGASLVLTGPDGPMAVQGSAVTSNLFAFLGIRPLLGPGFTPTARMSVFHPPAPRSDRRKRGAAR